MRYTALERSSPDAKKIVVSTYLNKEVAEEMFKEAQKQNRSMAAQISFVCKCWLEKKREQEKETEIDS